MTAMTMIHFIARGTEFIACNFASIACARCFFELENWHVPRERLKAAREGEIHYLSLFWRLGKIVRSVDRSEADCIRKKVKLYAKGIYVCVCPAILIAVFYTSFRFGAGTARDRFCH